MEIEVRRLRKSFLRNNGEPLLVLDAIDFKVEHGDFITIIGPSGCGKTTLLKIIAGIESPDQGEILHDLPPHDATIPIVWQEHRLFPWRTVIRNICFPLELNNIDRPKAHEKARSLLQLMGLNSFENYYPWQLSLGMAQRIAIARALATESSCLLMDEPFGSVDYQAKQILFQQLRDLHERHDLTIIYVTHDLRDAIRFSDRIIVLAARPSHVLEIIEPGKTTMPEYVLERHLWDLLR